MKIIITILITFLFLSNIYTIGNDLVGKIFDNSTGKPLNKASVRLEGTTFGTLTNHEGFFRLSRVPPGSYFIIVSFIGYEVYKRKVVVPMNDTIIINLQQQSLRMEEVVVSATKKMQAIQDVPVSISVISNDFLTERGYVRFDDALKQTTGLIINKDNINIRGSSGFSFGLGSRVAYLVDGIPFLSGDNGDAKFDIIPTEVIDKIEVVKGAGSALYGSSAIGGVINIVTKEYENEFINISAQSGIYTKPKYQQWIYSNKLSTKNFFMGSYGNDFGFFKAIGSMSFLNNESYRKYDKSQQLNFYTKFTKDLKNYGKLSLFGFYARDRRDDWVYWNSLDSATIPPTNTDLSRKLISLKVGGGLEWRFFLTSKTFGNFKANLYHTNLDFENIKDTNEYRRSLAYSMFNELQLNSHLPDNTIISYGINFQNNWVNSNIYGSRKQSLVSFFSQLEFTRIESWIFTLGSRLDWEKSDSSEANLEFSPKLGINYHLDNNKERYLRFSIGSGFRSPSLAERFASIRFGSFRVVPNFNLKAERSWSAELGGTFDFDFGNAPFIFDFALFYSRFTNLIDPQFDPNQIEPVIKFMNITRARIYGIEFSVKTLLFNFLPFSIGMNYLDPFDLNQETVLKYRSKFSINNSLSIPFEFIKFTSDFRYLSKIQKIDEFLRQQVPDSDARVPIYILDLYIIFNLKRFHLPIRVIISLQNALDYYYVEMVGNLAPTRHLSLRVQYPSQ
ncbi:MAG: TonB-dependent receptor [Candidatus Kapaibacteriales bacterium]